MSDHTPVLFNVFEDWNEESVVPHISFDSIHIRFARKRPIRRSLVLSGTYGRFDSNRNARFDSRFNSNANGRFDNSYQQKILHTHTHTHTKPINTKQD